MSSIDAKNLENLSFEDAIAELESIVLKLEEGDTDLDSLVSEFSKGSDLLKHCRSKVNAAELRIKGSKARKIRELKILMSDNSILKGLSSPDQLKTLSSGIYQIIM